MIISRTPFRISFAGGGSDLSSFYHREMGAVLSTSINKYVYIAVHPFFDMNKIQLKYSKTELVSAWEDIQHPIFREVLRMYKLSGIDLNSIADIPSGTGLGSSSSFTVGLLNAVNAYMNRARSGEWLGQMACKIEIDRIGSPIGKQDQYAAACGGLNLISFNPDDTVNVEKIVMEPEVKRKLENNLLMIYTGDTRSANALLKKQNDAINVRSKFEVQKEMVQLAFELKKALEKNNIDDFGQILHQGWLLKRKLTDLISTGSIDAIYERGLKSGALGGKLLGAGGGGFILFYCPQERQNKFKEEMSQFRELDFRFDNYGSKIIYIGER